MKISKKISTISIDLLADFVLFKFGPMSHLKLQKLLFYCEAYHLAYFGQSLINEEFEAWVHGPVCRELFNTFRDKSLLYSDLAHTGPDPTEDISNAITSDQYSLLDEVLSGLSEWTGPELERATHNEAPWKEARNGLGPADRCTAVISKDRMEEFYKKDLSA